jgi:hypothetical protein
LGKGVADGGAAVGEFFGEEQVLNLGVGGVEAHDRDASGAGPGVEFDGDRLGRSGGPGLKPEDKREPAVDDRPSLAE